MRPHAAALVIGLVAALLGPGCNAPPRACGEFPEGGGPAILVVREHETCELGRIRMTAFLERGAPFERWDVERYYEHSRKWEGVGKLEWLLADLRELLGPQFADGAARAIARVQETSSRPLGPDCEDEEVCLARAFGHGARLALEHRDFYVEDFDPHFGDDPKFD